jgi:hypothetical protein
LTGHNYGLVAHDGTIGVCKVLQGNVSEGIRILEQAILKRENEDYRGAGDWYRLILCEVYLQIIAGNEKLPVCTENLIRVDEAVSEFRLSVHTGACRL